MYPTNDDPLDDYNPAAHRPAAGGYGAAAQPASQFPIQAPANPAATPQVAPAPAQSQDAKDGSDLAVMSEAMGVTLLPGHRIAVSYTQPGAWFGCPGADVTVSTDFYATREDGSPLEAGERELLVDAALGQLVGEVYEVAKHRILELRKRLANEPKGIVSLHQAQYRPEQPPAGTMAGQTAPAGTGAASVHAAANGASTAEKWATNPANFRGGKPVEYLTSDYYSGEKLEAAVTEWLLEQGLDPQWFVLYDERPGTRSGVQPGGGMTAALNVKWSDEAKKVLRANGAGALEKMAVARVNFNKNESLYIYFGKNADPVKSVDVFMQVGRGKQLFGGAA